MQNESTSLQDFFVEKFVSPNFLFEEEWKRISLKNWICFDRHRRSFSIPLLSMKILGKEEKRRRLACKLHQEAIVSSTLFFSSLVQELKPRSSLAEVVPEKGEKSPLLFNEINPLLRQKFVYFPIRVPFNSRLHIYFKGAEKLGWKIVPRLSDMNRGPHFEMVGFMQIKSSLSMKIVWARERPLCRVWKFLHEITYVWLPFFEQLNLVICLNSGVKCNSIWIKRVSILQRLF